MKEIEKEIAEVIKNVNAGVNVIKENSDELAKEYIRTHLVLSIIGLFVGIFCILVAIGFLIAAYYAKDGFGFGLISILPGILGLIFIGISIPSLIEVLLQPKRMAIYAITSLLD